MLDLVMFADEAHVFFADGREESHEIPFGTESKMRYRPWIGFAVFLLVYLGLRVFWLSGDPGIAAAWEYGYNATDEGYYLVGGKEKLLWGCFVDLARTEAFTYGFSAGTHGLSYLAHLVFGLSTWTWRLPFFVIATLAWCVGYWHLARRSGAATATMLSIAFSCVPMLVAYERTASNDVFIGSLTVVAYVLATGSARWRVFAAAVVTGLIVLVKPSVWVILPIVLAGVLQERKFGRVWIDAVLFLASAVACIFACRLLAALIVLPDAQRAGVTVWEIVRRTTTHYPLPSIFDISSHFKGISAFPRDPSYAMLGVSTAFVFVLPVIMALRSLFALKFNGNTLLFCAVPTYVAAINVMNTQYTHYFIPALMMLPILTEAAARELSVDCRESGAVSLRRLWVPLGFTVFVLLVSVVLLLDFGIDPNTVQQFYSRIYNFPSRNVWGATYGPMALFVASVAGALLALRGLAVARRFAVAWVIAAFVAASAIFTVLPAVQIAPHIKQSSELFFAPMAVMLVVSGLMLVSVFGLSDRIDWKRFAAAFVLLSVASCYVLTPNWRQAAKELVRPPTHYHDQAADELRKLLPDDAIVIGERSNQMLMSLPVRTATTFASNSDPIPVIKSILAVEPNAKLYALADSQHAYNLQHYRKNAKDYRLNLVKTLKMPSFANGAPADVHLCQIIVQPRK